MNSPDTGSDYLLSALAEEGVSTLFGFVGEGNSHLLDRVNEADIDYRYARHETVAVSMADGYARVSGEVGVCTLTHGPGLTNGLTGIACADRDNVPMVIVVGDTSIAGREESLQYLEHLKVTAPVSVYGTRVEAAATLPERIRSAFRYARGRRGPAVLELPTDVQESPAPGERYEAIRRMPQRVRPDPTAVEAAVEVLDAAESPAILAGGGAAIADAKEAIQALAEHVGAPVATTFYGKGILPESHPMVSGIAGTFNTPANDALLQDADVLLALGAQLSGKSTQYGALYRDADIVQVDVDREAFGRYVDPAVAVVGDARATAEELARRVERNPKRAKAVRECIRAAGRPGEVEFESDPEQVDPRHVTTLLSEHLPDGSIVTVDSGNNTGFPAVFHEINGDGSMLANGNFGSMGFALPAAIGAQIAAPDRTVVCYIGDGALLQVLQEVETAVRYALPIVVVVYNDAAYGIIRHRQLLEYERETSSAYGAVDFAAVGRDLGARGATVRSADDINVVTDFVSSDAEVPLIVDVRTIPEVTRPGFPPY